MERSRSYVEYAQIAFSRGTGAAGGHPSPSAHGSARPAFRGSTALPPDTSTTELEERVSQVLTEVDLTQHMNQRIDSLSEGQRKRTAIALEMLTAPQLLFLDEPTSGLDPELDKQVIGSLRASPDASRVVLVVTHSVPALDVCDRVLVLARGGRVAFFGPPAEVLPFFGVDNYAEALAALEDQTWAGRYALSPARDAYLAGTTSAAVALPAGDSPPPPRAAPGRQLWTLIRRNAAVVAADRLFVVLLIGMPVVLGLMALAFPGQAGLSVNEAKGDFNQIQQRLIVLVVGAALMGAALAGRELVVERPIYRRELAAGLSPSAYLLSKVLVLGVLVACQCAAFTMLALLGRPGPDGALVLGNGHIEIAVAVAAVGITMTLAGLVVSAAATSRAQTMPALLALVWRSLFCAVGCLHYPDVSAWNKCRGCCLLALGTPPQPRQQASRRPPVPVADQLYEPTAQQWLIDIAFLSLQALAFLALAAWALQRSVTRNAWK